MGPPDTEPSGAVRRNSTPSVHSANFVDIPSRPAAISQKVAPGPPVEMATATPAMLPMPTVPDTAVVRAWNCEISPGSLGSARRPEITRTACPNPRTLMNPR